MTTAPRIRAPVSITPVSQAIRVATPQMPIIGQGIHKAGSVVTVRQFLCFV